MLDSFVIRVLLSFVVAGVWITLATILAERFGTKIGGLLGNLPSTIAISIFFIAITQSVAFAAEAAKVAPLGMAVDSIFLFVYIAALNWHRKLAPLLALGAWLLFAIPIGLFGYDDIAVGVVAYLAVTAVLFLVVEYKMHIPSMKKRKMKYSMSELGFRALFAGGIVAGAVVIAAVGGPIWGGIFSIFPAVMLSTMYLLTRAQGPKFAQATGKIMIPSSVGIIVYAVAVHFAYPAYGLVVGTVVSYLVAVVPVALMYPLMKRVA